MRKSVLFSLCVGMMLAGIAAAQEKEPEKEPEKKEDDLIEGKKLAYWVEMLRDKENDPANRRKAAEILAKSGPKAKPATATFLEMLQDKEDPNNRSLAAYVLPHLQADPKQVVPPLVAALKDKNPTVIQQAAHALALIGPEIKMSLDALKETLKAEDPNSRLFAVYVLGNARLNPKDDAILPPLIDVWKDDKVEAVRKAAADAIKKLDPETAKKIGVP